MNKWLEGLEDARHESILVVIGWLSFSISSLLLLGKIGFSSHIQFFAHLEYFTLVVFVANSFLFLDIVHWKKIAYHRVAWLGLYAVLGLLLYTWTAAQRGYIYKLKIQEPTLGVYGFMMLVGALLLLYAYRDRIKPIWNHIREYISVDISSDRSYSAHVRSQFVLSPANKVFLIATCAVAIIGAIFLRVYQLDVLPYSGDEGLYPLLMAGIEQTGLPEFSSGMVYARSYGATYVTYLISLLMGVNHISMRLFAVLCGIVIAYIVISMLWKRDRVLATSMGVYVAVLPYLVIWSRQARFYMFGLLLMLVTTWILYKGTERRMNALELTLSVLFILFTATNFEFSYILIPASLIYIFVVRGKTWLKDGQIWVLGVSLVLGTYINRFVNGYFWSTSIPTFDPKGKTAIGFFHNYWTYAMDYYNTTFAYSNAILIVVAICLTGYFVFKRQKIELRMNRLILLWLIIAVTNYAFGVTTLARIHTKYVFPVYLFGGVVLVWYVLSLLRNASFSPRLKAAIPLMMVSLVFANMLFSRTVTDYKSRDTVGNYTFGSVSNTYLWKSFFTNQYSFHGITSTIRSPRYLEAVEYIEENMRPGDIYMNTDIYNTYPYLEYDYILNTYLADYMGYAVTTDELPRSIYTDTPFIRTKDQLREVMKNKGEDQRIWVLADMKFQQHNPKTHEIIEKDFKLELATPNDFIGLNYGYTDTEVLVYSYK